MPAAKVYQGVVVANAFHFVISAGQACLIPFLSLYFLYLDLDPFQTGLLLGIKALTGSLSSAFWTQCVTTTSRRLKFVLIFSLIALVTSHLVMVLMPSMKDDKSEDFCRSREVNLGTIDCSKNINHSDCFKTAVDFPFSDLTLFTDESTEKFTPSSVTPDFTGHNLSASIFSNSTRLGTSATSYPRLKTVTSVPVDISDKNKTQIKANAPNSFLDDYWLNDNSAYARKRRHGDHNDEAEAADQIEEKPVESGKSYQDDNGLLLPNDDVQKDDAVLGKRLKSIQNQIFSAMMVLVVVSELFSSPWEQVADELYLSFLECHDLPLSRRKTTRCWSLLGGSIMPWVVVVIIDQLPCYVPPLESHRILFHFWLFSLIHLLSILFSICYPASTSFPPDVSRTSGHQISSGDSYQHGRRWANLSRGMKLVAVDGRAVLATSTIFVIGFHQGVICTFLPWVIHNLVTDGSEFYIGAAIGLAAAGDLLARFIGEWICRKIGHAITITFGLLIIATRLALYGFILRPWMVLIGESAHLFGGALVATAVACHPAFRTTTRGIEGDSEGGNSKNRKRIRGHGSLASFAAAEATSIDSALRQVRSGFGFSVGCCVAGVLAWRYGMSMAFWSAAATAVVWCLLFVVLYPCCKSKCTARGGSSRRKSRTTGLASSLLAGRYKKLSKREEDDDEDEDDEDDDYDVEEDGSTEEEKADWMDTVMRKHS